MIHILLWWNALGQRWVRLYDVSRPGGNPERSAFPGVPPGDQFFMICVVINEETVNAIPYRYEIGADGEILRLIGGLDDDEEAELTRLRAKQKSPEEVARFNALGQKSVSATIPQGSVAEAFLRDLPAPPIADRNYGIWKRIAEMGGDVGALAAGSSTLN